MNTKSEKIAIKILAYYLYAFFNVLLVKGASNSLVDTLKDSFIIIDGNAKQFNP